MKKLCSIILLVAVSTIVFSQTTKQELEVARELFGMEKKLMVANFVELPETDVFWSIYDEYEKEREAFGEKRYNLLLEYAGNYVNYSDERLEKIMADNIKVRQEMEKLFMKYYKRVKKECGIKTASQFYMLQRFYESSIRAKVLGNLPLVEN